MKLEIVLALAAIGATLSGRAGAETNAAIALNLRAANFTNLQGRAYTDVRLMNADLDGITYKVANGVGGGFVSYTNLHHSLLESWNIPTNRIASATERALQRAEQNKARQILAAKAVEENWKAKKKVAFDKGYHDGSRRGAADEAAGKSHPNEEALDGIARTDGRDFWVSPITGRGTLRQSNYDHQEKILQADYLAGFKAGYPEGFKKSEKPAF